MYCYCYLYMLFRPAADDGGCCHSHAHDSPGLLLLLQPMMADDGGCCYSQAHDSSGLLLLLPMMVVAATAMPMTHQACCCPRYCQ